MKLKYMVINIKNTISSAFEQFAIEELLDRQNETGDWELITVDNGIAYFKRPVIISSPDEAIIPGGVSEREMPKEQ